MELGPLSVYRQILDRAGCTLFIQYIRECARGQAHQLRASTHDLRLELGSAVGHDCVSFRWRFGAWGHSGVNNHTGRSGITISRTTKQLDM